MLSVQESKLKFHPIMRNINAIIISVGVRFEQILQMIFLFFCILNESWTIGGKDPAEGERGI